MKLGLSKLAFTAASVLAIVARRCPALYAQLLRGLLHPAFAIAAFVAAGGSLGIQDFQGGDWGAALGFVAPVSSAGGVYPPFADGRRADGPLGDTALALPPAGAVPPGFATDLIGAGPSITNS